MLAKTDMKNKEDEISLNEISQFNTRIHIFFLKIRYVFPPAIQSVNVCSAMTILFCGEFFFEHIWEDCFV